MPALHVARQFTRFSIVAGLALLPALPAFAVDTADSPQEQVDNSKFQFSGIVNSNAVFVRSGPSDNDYPTVKLDKGATLTVVGIKYDWLKIAPPEGSFCYVAKVYVDRRGDGSVGRTNNTPNVRIGSALNTMKTKLAMQLAPNTDVTIVGEQDEYFKIAPPAGTFLYVKKQFVDPGQMLPKGDGSDVAIKTAPTPPIGGGDTPVPDPNTVVVKPPTTQEVPPTVVASDDDKQFNMLAAAYADAQKQKLEDQTGLADMTAGYTKLSTSTVLAESLRRIAEQRALFLKGRLADQQQLLAVRKTQEEQAGKITALQAEESEIKARLAANAVKHIPAVGTLRPSSLQQGGETLYRLTDPSTGRTIVYIRSNDVKIGAMAGQFIGVKGDVVNDQQLSVRVITPTVFESVDPSKLNNGVTAQIVPPSLIPAGPGQGQATAD